MRNSMSIMQQFCDAIVFSAPNSVEVRKLELPKMGDDEILVKTMYTMVSSGTELRVLSGIGESEGKFPIVPGYSAVGEIVAVGSKVKGFHEHDLVSGMGPARAAGSLTRLWGGQCSYHVYPTSGYACPIILPAGAKALDYVAAEVAAISWRGVNSANARPGETAVVIGQGLIGALSGAWLVERGCRVIVADVSDLRLSRAEAWGVSAAINVISEDLHERIQVLCPEGTDIVVEASASAAGLRLAYSLVRNEEPIAGKDCRWPRLLLQASYTDTVAIHPSKFFSGAGVLLLTPLDRRPEDRSHTVEAIRSGRLMSANFVDRIVPFHNAPATYAQLRDHKDKIFSAAFDWSSAE